MAFGLQRRPLVAHQALQQKQLEIQMNWKDRSIFIIPQGIAPDFNPREEKWSEYNERFESACKLHRIADKKMANHF